MINGQITQDSERAKMIKEAIHKFNCKNLFEIGTWGGLGSTLCIIESMTEDSTFQSIESNKAFYEIAVSNLINYSNRVKLIYGTIVNENEVLDFTKNLSLDSTKQGWLNEDLANLGLCSNVFGEIPDKIDFLLLDGGEFSTYPEWVKLKSRTYIVALDDIREIKTKKIYDELIIDEEYEIISKTDEGNGFCIFKKK